MQPEARKGRNPKTNLPLPKTYEQKKIKEKKWLMNPSHPLIDNITKQVFPSSQLKGLKRVAPGSLQIQRNNLQIESSASKKLFRLTRKRYVHTNGDNKRCKFSADFEAAV